MSNITATLKNWHITSNEWGCIAWGNIFEDTKKRWPDGRRIHSSQMTGYEINRDGIIFQTLNSVYWLPYEFIYEDVNKFKIVASLPEWLERAKILLDK